jgi:uncharacterized protein DUF3147
MIVKAKFSRLRQTKGWEWLVRFVFGGVVTAITGLIAKELGPVVGGLFLAFPGIFPAGVTLVERHEKEKKQKHGHLGVPRGRKVSAVLAAGAVAGCVGLVAFALAVWRLAPRHATWQWLLAAGVAWVAISLLAWLARFRWL